VRAWALAVPVYDGRTGLARTRPRGQKVEAAHLHHPWEGEKNGNPVGITCLPLDRSTSRSPSVHEREGYFGPRKK
jgi:hypothetical protein